VVRLLLRSCRNERKVNSTGADGMAPLRGLFFSNFFDLCIPSECIHQQLDTIRAILTLQEPGNVVTVVYQELPLFFGEDLWFRLVSDSGE